MKNKYLSPEMDIEKLYINDTINAGNTDDSEDNFDIISDIMQPTN